MTKRARKGQSEHDAAVEAAGSIYRDNGIHAWVNPGSQRNKDWAGRYIDVIAARSRQADRAWVIEVETEN